MENPVQLPVDEAPDMVTVSFGVEWKPGFVEYFPTLEQALAMRDAANDDYPLIRLEERRVWLDD